MQVELVSRGKQAWLSRSGRVLQKQDHRHPGQPPLWAARVARLEAAAQLHTKGKQVNRAGERLHTWPCKVKLKY